MKAIPGGVQLVAAIDKKIRKVVREKISLFDDEKIRKQSEKK